MRTSRVLFKVLEAKSIYEEIKKRCEVNEVKLIDYVPVLPDTMFADARKRRQALKDFRLGCEIGAYFETGMVQADTFHLPVHVEPLGYPSYMCRSLGAKPSRHSSTVSFQG